MEITYVISYTHRADQSGIVIDDFRLATDPGSGDKDEDEEDEQQPETDQVNIGTLPQLVAA